MSIKKEFIPFIIVLGIICLNIPIVLLLYFLKPDFLEKFATIIAPIQCIMIGLTTIYSELKGKKIKRKNYKVYEGIIKDTEFKPLNSNWLKVPVVSYIVNGKKYEITADFGFNGIASFFIKGKKVKVYYKEENPKIAFVNNYVVMIGGTIFIIFGICILLI